MFGAATDSALLLVARCRGELRQHEDRHEAMAVALRRAGPAIIASAATVAVGMLCMTVAKMNPTKGLGPVNAVGVGVGLLAMLTLLPALLVILGRWVVWPARPVAIGLSATGGVITSAGLVLAGTFAALGRRRDRPGRAAAPPAHDGDHAFAASVATGIRGRHGDR